MTSSHVGQQCQVFAFLLVALAYSCHLLHMFPRWPFVDMFRLNQESHQTHLEHTTISQNINCVPYYGNDNMWS